MNFMKNKIRKVYATKNIAWLKMDKLKLEMGLTYIRLGEITMPHKAMLRCQLFP